MLRLLVFVFLFIPSLLWATTPVISNVTGTIQTGQTLTITGTTMMDEDKTNWHSFYQSGTAYGFEGSSYTSDGYLRAPDELPGGYCSSAYSESTKLSGSKSVYSNCTANDKTGGGFYQDFPSSVTALYARGYFMWNSYGTIVWPGDYVKNIYPLSNYSPGYYIQPQGVGTRDAPPTAMLARFDDINHEYNVANFLTLGRWYCIEVYFKTSSVGHLNIWVDGVEYEDSATTATGTMERLLFGPINMDGVDLPGTFNWWEWIDNFAISTSRVYPSSVIEIGNSATYAEATKVYQAPTLLSDTSIAITADLTGLGDGPYYLWVTNNKQERSVVYNLSGDDGTPARVHGLSIMGGSIK